MQERKMTKKEKSKEKRLKKKYDDSDMKASMKKQYGKDWKAVYYATIRKKAMENALKEAEENTYTVVHAKHGKEVIKATSSYGAAKKYAQMKKLKSTAGVDAHLMEGYQILPPIDKERYTEIPGMEGPMMTRSGKVVYYDPQEGAYYDRDTDMYLSYDEWKELDEDSPMKTAIDKAVAQAMSTPAPAYSVRPKARPKNLAPSSSLRPRARPTINIGSVRKGDPATRGIDPRDNYSPEDLKRLLMQSAYARMNEGRMSDIHARISNADDPEQEIIDMMNDFNSPEGEYIRREYEITAGENGLHGDDDMETIVAIMADDIGVAEGHSPHKKGTKKYKAHMAAMHANSAEPKGKMLEGYEGEVSAILQALDIEHHWSNGYLHVNQRDLEDVKNRLADTDMDMPSIKVYEGKNKIGPQGMMPGDRVEHEGDMYEVIAVDGDILTVDNLQTGNRTKFKMDDVTKLYGMDAMTDQDKENAEAMFKRLKKAGSGSLKHVATEGKYSKKKKKKKYETVDIKKVKSAVNMQESTDSQAVAEYIRINLNESHDTWEKVNEEVYHVIGNLTEGHSADPLEVYSAVHKRHMQQYFDHEMGIKENIDKLRDIVKDQSAMSIKFADGSMKVDMTTANIFVQMYDKMKEGNQEKIDQMMRTKAGFLKVLDFFYGAMK